MSLKNTGTFADYDKVTEEAVKESIVATAKEAIRRFNRGHPGLFVALMKSFGEPHGFQAVMSEVGIDCDQLIEYLYKAGKFPKEERSKELREGKYLIKKVQVRLLSDAGYTAQDLITKGCDCENCSENEALFKLIAEERDQGLSPFEGHVEPPRHNYQEDRAYN